MEREAFALLGKACLIRQRMRWLSIEHEDAVLSRMEGMRRSIDLLNRSLIDEPSDYALPRT